MNLPYSDWDHYKDHYNNWKNAWLRKKAARDRSGAAADPIAKWENELYDLEADNPKFNPDKRVILFS